MKTLYEILEVSETASKEVIEKAYKVLAKKYHPDLQTPENKELAEKNMKEINEAYETLSDNTKRKEYNLKLANQREIEKQKELQNQLNQQSQSNMYEKQSIQQEPQRQSGQTEAEQRYNDMQRRKYEAELLKQQEKMRKQMEKNMQEQYENAYYNYLRSLGYKIKERWTWKKTKSLIIILLIMFLIGALLWFIPPTRKMMLDFYNSNVILKAIIDIIINIITAIFKAFGGLFKNN